MPLRLIALLLVFSLGCVTTTTRIEYRDGYFFVTGLPEVVEAITITLKRGSGMYYQVITVAVEDGESERICLGAMYRGTYDAGDIGVKIWDEDDEVIAEKTNAEDLDISPTRDDLEIPWDKFE